MKKNKKQIKLPEKINYAVGGSLMGVAYLLIDYEMYSYIIVLLSFSAILFTSEIHIRIDFIINVINRVKKYFKENNK
ncbi:MAG TPA: hypothetical protein VK982_07525 [Bacteroidales bacterium]|nr:hypothetical protein [Bacteroidales bacterium]